MMRQIILSILLLVASATSNSKSISNFYGSFANALPQIIIGGFGGGACSPQRTPVILIHGNVDSAESWKISANGGTSVYDILKSNGYQDCEIFAISYLTEIEQIRIKAGKNKHTPEKFDQILAFIQSVLSFTKMEKVDVVAHSLGVTMTIAALTYHENSHKNFNTLASWKHIRRFINIAGAPRGLASCISSIYYPLNFPTCEPEELDNYYKFGFYPDSAFVKNRWTNETGEFSMYASPNIHPNVTFYTIHAGNNDQVHCRYPFLATSSFECSKGALFKKSPNVVAQLNVAPNTTVFDKYMFYSSEHSSEISIDHFGARSQTGEIIYQMLSSSCKEILCKGRYVGDVKVD